MGLTNPSQLQPEFIMRRINVQESKSFKELHDFLEPGQLLTKNIPDDFKNDWLLADSNKF
jgi:hypothetical protein